MILFFDFVPFDSLGCVLENPCPDIRRVRITGCPICRGTTVTDTQALLCKLMLTILCKWNAALKKRVSDIELDHWVLSGILPFDSDLSELDRSQTGVMGEAYDDC